MRLLYLISVWLHILAASVWVGGMAFLVLVVVPWLRSRERADSGAFLRETGLRFRAVGWGCFAILLVTGSFNLWVRGVGVSDLLRPSFWASAFGRIVALKLSVFVVVLAISALHDFAIGPRATLAMQRDPRGPDARALRRRASLLGRANALLALLLVALAVMLVRGGP